MCSWLWENNRTWKVLWTEGGTEEANCGSQSSWQPHKDVCCWGFLLGTTARAITRMGRENKRLCILPGECTQGTKNKLREEHSSYLFPSVFLGPLLFPAGENEANRLINVWLILQYTRTEVWVKQLLSNFGLITLFNDDGIDHAFSSDKGLSTAIFWTSLPILCNCY